MPRAARKKGDSGIYHVMLRGINRQIIFEDDEDCEKYLQCLAECRQISGFTLHAYCLMGNHLHLLLEENTEPMEQVFKRAGARYVFWYNWKYKRSGHLLQDRFKSEPIDGDSYFIAALRYILQNPIKAGLCTDMAAYPWSSYRELLGVESQPLTDRRKAIELLSEKELRIFMETPSDKRFLDLRPDLRLTDREASESLKGLCGLHNLTEFQTLGREIQQENIRQCANQHCSIRQLVRLTGLSKAVVERMLATADK